MDEEWRCVEFTIENIHTNGTRTRLDRSTGNGCWGDRFVIDAYRIEAQGNHWWTGATRLNDGFRYSITIADGEKETRMHFEGSDEIEMNTKISHLSAWNIARMGCLAMNSTWETKFARKSYGWENDSLSANPLGSKESVYQIDFFQRCEWILIRWKEATNVEKGIIRMDLPLAFLNSCSR